jgi:hypothetical protein
LLFLASSWPQLAVNTTEIISPQTNIIKIMQLDYVTGLKPSARNYGRPNDIADFQSKLEFGLWRSIVTLTFDL